MDLETYAGFDPVTYDEGISPEHQFQLRSQLDLPYDLQLDGAVYYVDHLSDNNPNDASDFDIDHYWRLDLRLGWQPTEWLDLSLVGQNLTDNRHQEFVPRFGNTSVVPRSVYGKATASF